MLLRRSSVGAILLAASCGPKVDVPIGDEGADEGGNDVTTSPTASASAPGDGDGGTLFGDEGEDSGTPPPDESDGEGPPPTDVPADDPAPGWCDDPLEVDPLHAPLYVFCLRGLMELSSHTFADGTVGYGAYAQFYTVHAEAELEWEERILDPLEGEDDCALRRYGNSGWGRTEQVLWEDAGNVTFVTPSWSVPGTEYGDPVSVIGYQADLSEMGFEPSHGESHGLIATGDTTPAFDLSAAVVLPDAIVVTDPPITESPAVDYGALVIAWDPSPLGFSTWIFLNIPIAGDWDYTLYCRMADDGNFEIPAELLAQLPLPVEANVHMSRTDARIVGHDGERGILARAWTSTEGHLTIE